MIRDYVTTGTLGVTGMKDPVEAALGDVGALDRFERAHDVMFVVAFKSHEVHAGGARGSPD